MPVGTTKLAGSFSTLGGYGYPHSFTRLANRHVLSTFQGANGVYAPARSRCNVRVSLAHPDRRILLTWTLANAMPVKFKAGDLTARGTEVAIEELHIVHEGLRLEAGAS